MDEDNCREGAVSFGFLEATVESSAIGTFYFQFLNVFIHSFIHPHNIAFSGCQKH
jgi:hypothetical protein